MAIITGQQINNYYNNFKELDVTFTRQVIKVLGLIPDQVYLKCLDKSFSCIIYSSSMIAAKLIANLTEASFQTFREANNNASLRFSFKLSDKQDPLSFSVTGKISGYNQYNKDRPDLYFISLSYTQRPPDDLIEILGELLEVNTNAKRRKEIRININPSSIKGLGLESRDVLIYIDSVPRKCIIRDLSFSGVKVLIVGVAKYLVNKTAAIRFSFLDPKELINLTGKVLRFEEVEGRKDIAALAIQFDEDKIPIQYKVHINSYIRSQRLNLQRSSQ